MQSHFELGVGTCPAGNGASPGHKETQTLSDVRVASTRMYGVEPLQEDTGLAHETSVVAVGRTDDQVLFTIGQFVKLEQIKSDVNVAA